MCFQTRLGRAGALGTTLLLSTLTAFATDPAEEGGPAQPSLQGPPEGQHYVVSNLAVTLYGYVKADMAYDTANMDNGNYARWVVDEDDNQFNITARQTRLGLKVVGPEVEGVRTFGRVEIDFYGSTGTSYDEENGALLRLRHAYISLDDFSNDLSFLAGQTSDVISPLVAPTINYSVAWWTGDIGYRRNQFRLTKGFKIGEETRLKAAVAATRSSGGEDTGQPGWQGRLGWTFPGFNGLDAEVGLSGHYAPEMGQTAKVHSNSFCVDLSLPMADPFTLEGEWFTGKNLDSYLGGIGQGVTGNTEIASTGFWGALTWKVTSLYLFNFGYAREKPDAEDLAGGDRSENSTLWANINYAINKATTLGFEVSQHDTSYLGAPDQSGTRFQLAVIFKF